MALLTIDIGNTTITAGLFTHGRLTRRFSVPTTAKSGSNGLTGKIKSRDRVEGIIISSVVPKATRSVINDLKRILPVKPLVLGKDLSVPVRNLYSDPRQVGQDRLVNAFAGITLFGSPLIVVDFGTAVTFDVVSEKGDYLGGLILPGLEISLDALHTRTALLPRVKLFRPKGLIGRDTANSITSGIVYGFAALTDDLCSRIRAEIGAKALVIGTGGAISHVAPYCRSFHAIEPDLTLKGLNLIYNSLKK